MDIHIHRQEALDDFNSEMGAKRWKMRDFIISLKIWCNHFEIELNPADKLNTEKRCQYGFYGPHQEALFLRPKGFKIKDLNKKIKSQQPKPEKSNPTLDIDESNKNSK
jgi:hypothetical protein